MFELVSKYKKSWNDHNQYLILCNSGFRIQSIKKLNIILVAVSPDGVPRKSIKKRQNHSDNKLRRNLKKRQAQLVSEISLTNVRTDKVDSENDWLIQPTFESVTIIFRNGNRYEGPVYGKLMQGYGIFYWADGSKYTVSNINFKMQNSYENSPAN